MPRRVESEPANCRQAKSGTRCWRIPAVGDFYVQASGGSVTLSAAGYDYNSDWTPLLAGLSPAGMAASLTARPPVLRTLSLCTCCRHYPGTATRGIPSLTSPQSCQPSLISLSGRPMHRLFRGLLGVHSHYGLHTRAVTVYRDTLSEGFSHFVTSIAAPVASGWSVSPGGICTHWKAPPFTAHTPTQSLGTRGLRRRRQAPPLPVSEADGKILRR